MLAELFWVFGGNEGMNKKVRKHQSFKKCRNIEMKEIVKVKE